MIIERTRPPARGPGCSEILETRLRGDARAITIPHEPAAVPAARRQVLADIEPRLGATIAEESAVVISELLGNAVRHAQPREDGRVMLRWQVRGDVIDLEVSDGGSAGSIQPMRPASMSVHGRGLRIVRHLAHEWGVVQEESGGRTVWACLGGPSRRRRRVEA